MARNNGVSTPLVVGAGIVGAGLVGLLIYRATRGPAAAGPSPAYRTDPLSSSGPGDAPPGASPRGGGRDVAQGTACAVIEVDDSGLLVDGRRTSLRDAVTACRTPGPNARVELVFRVNPESPIGKALLLALASEQVAYSVRPGTLDTPEGRAALEAVRREYEQSRGTFGRIFDRWQQVAEDQRRAARTAGAWPSTLPRERTFTRRGRRG